MLLLLIRLDNDDISSNDALLPCLCCALPPMYEQTSKVAFINALTDASAVVFNHQCAAAHSRMKAMTNALYDSIDEAYQSLSSKCAKSTGGLTPVSVNAQDAVKKVLMNNKPITVAIGEALQDAVSCGCKPGNCFWCVPSDHEKNVTSNVVSAFDLGNNVTGSFQQPLNWNQMAIAAVPSKLHDP